MGKQRIKPNYRRRVLRLPDLDHCKLAVLNSLGSPASRRVYEYAINQFIAWYCSEPRLALNRIVVVRYRMHLESRGLAANTINQQLAAVRRLAHEAADSGLLSPEPGRRHQPSERGQATWVSLRQLVECGAKLPSAQRCLWRQHARQARLCHAGHAVRLWLPQIGTGRLRVGRGPDAPGALGSRGPDRQGRPDPHRPDSRMGEGGARSVDTGGRGHGGKDLSSRCQSGKSVGKRHLAECRLVRSQDLLRESGLGAYCTA
jgi:hypothetical protein